MDSTNSNISLHDHLRRLDKFVEREIRGNVTALVARLIQLDEDFPSVNYDYQDAAEQAGFVKNTRTGNITRWTEAEGDEAYHTWAEACDAGGIEPICREIFTYWLVSDWLAEELEQEGEAICEDLFGQKIWGRTTFGQSISCDRVIEDIYSRLSGEKVTQ